jgi:cytochrome oxidase Cu insertion factor (SCO1/SenC/PrrC family)
MRRRLGMVVGGLALLAGGGAYAIAKNSNTGQQAAQARKANVRQGEHTQIGKLNLGAPFTLTDQHGNKRSSEEFKGKYMLIYFGFANCPDFVRFLKEIFRF